MAALRSSSGAAAAARSSSHKACHLHILLGLLVLVLVLQQGEAYEFKVGGAKGWAVPSDNATTYSQWAEHSRFQIGDSLLFVYRADQDSVLHVSKEDYNGCRTEAPMAKFSDGHTVFPLDRSGPFYFISGTQDHCVKNQKLVVVVLADRSNRSAVGSNQTTAAPPSPPPSGSPPVMAPAPTPESEYPSPPTGPVEIVPSPAPSEQAPPNAASPAGISFVGSIVGALLGSWALVF